MSGRRFALGAWALTCVIAAAALGGHWAGFLWNGSASVPRGLWRVQTGTLARGSVAALCPPDTPIFRAAREARYVPRGFCEGGYAPLLKPVAALPGDAVDVGPDGVRVNGVLLRNSEQLAHDGTGRELAAYPHGRYMVAPGQLWLVSDYHPASFDGRYFGPLPMASVLGVARPVWLWGEE